MKKNPVDEYLRKRKNSNRHRNKLLAVILTLSMAVFFTVNMGLRLTGITLTGDGDTAAAESSNDTAESTAETVNEEVTPDAAENTAAPENSAGGGPSTADPVTTETPAAEDTQQFTLTSAEADGFTVTVSGDPSVLPYPAEEMSVSVKEQDVSDLNETQKNLYDTLLASQAEQADQIYEASADEDGTQTEEVDDTTLDAAKQSTEDQNVVTSDGTAVENNNSDTKSSTVTYLFDVTLKHGDEAVEPKGEVQVSIQSDLFKSTDSDLSIIHLDEVKNKAVDTEAVINTDEGTAVLTTSSFSAFVIEGENQKIYDSLFDAFNQAPDGATIKLDSNYDENVLKDKTFTIDKNLTLDLNGHFLHFNETGNSAPFKISAGGTFTIKDSSAEGDKPDEIDTVTDETVNNNYNNAANNDLNDKDKTDTVTYYVTQSSASETTTAETTKKHVYRTKGYIVGDIKTGNNTGIVYVSSGATFNLQSGLLTAHTNYKNGYDDGHSVFNCGTFNMTGGYIVGRNSNQKGAGICATSGSTTNLSGGVIAANSTSDGGGAVYLDGGNLNISKNAIISGNNSSGSSGEYNGGGGIYAINSAKIVINGGYITNNSYTGAGNTDNATKYGGGAIWTNAGSEITINDGQVTGNYSKNGGGGLYIGSWNSKATLYLNGGVVASNYCETGEGGGIRVAGNDVSNAGSLVEISGDKKTYITNNINNTDNSWGGGGVFVQQNGNLSLTNVLITSNSADGYGGGFASCPTGNTNINMSYAGIYSNTAAGTNFSKKSLSEKNDDEKAKINDGVNGQQAADYFVGAYSHGTEKVATLTNSMLGGGKSYWTGQAYEINSSVKFVGTLGKDNYKDKTELGICKMAALHAEPVEEDKIKAIAAARVFITGNTSHTNGGGIMTNGYVTVGQVLSSNKYPVININGTKVLQLNNNNQNITAGEFGFELLKNKPNYLNGNLEISTDSVIATTANRDSEGPTNSSAFSFNNVALNDFIPSDQDSGEITLYLVETKGNEESITYSQDFYEITIPFDTEIITEGDGSSQTKITVYRLVNDSNHQLTIKKYTDAYNSTQVYPTDENKDGDYIIYPGNHDNNYKYTGTINLSDLGYTFVNNIPAYLLTIYKYQAGAETTGSLEGVQFKLYSEYDSDTGIVSKQLSADSAGTPFGEDGILTTTADGVVKVGYLKYGEYYLEETKAKDGFEKLDKVIKITVNSAGISATYADGAGLSNIVNEDKHMPSGEDSTSDNHYCLHIANNSGTVLPSTGGIGTDWFILGGCGLISIALTYALLMHSKREGGDLG